MSISGISANTGSYQTNQTSSFTKIKEDFDNLGSALKAGNLDDAKKAYAQLQKDAPAKSGTGSNPMSEDMDSLGKALDSGDLKSAQDAFAKIQDKISQGKQAGGHGGAKKASASSSGSQSDNKVYDKKDINKDGTVSNVEEMIYDLQHPEDADASQTNSQGSLKLNTLIGQNVDTLA